MIVSALYHFNCLIAFVKSVLILVLLLCYYVMKGGADNLERRSADS